MRLVFMGTPDFSVTVLKALLAARHEIVCVYAQPPRPAGRGMALRPTPVHAFAEAHGIEVRTPISLKAPDEQDRFNALKADAAVVVAYGLLLPKASSGCAHVRLFQCSRLASATLAGGSAHPARHHGGGHRNRALPSCGWMRVWIPAR